MGRSISNCKPSDSRRLFVNPVDELLYSDDPFDSRGTKRRAPCPCNSFHYGRSFHNGTVAYDASTRARCHATDYRASFTPDDTGTPGSVPNHAAHHTSTGATRVCPASGTRQPVCEYAARSRLLQCLPF